MSSELDNFSQRKDAAETLIDYPLVYLHSIAALVTVLVAIVFGIGASLQFVHPDMGWLSEAWGRLRYAHTQGIMIGWLGNAFLAFLYHAVPVLTGRAVASPNNQRPSKGLATALPVNTGTA